MPKWRNEYRRCDNCRREYRPQRETQSYCSRACRRQAAYGRERFKAATVGRRERRLEASDKLSGSLVAGSFRNGVFSSTEPIPCKPTKLHSALYRRQPQARLRAGASIKGTRKGTGHSTEAHGHPSKAEGARPRASRPRLSPRRALARQMDLKESDRSELTEGHPGRRCHAASCGSMNSRDMQLDLAHVEKTATREARDDFDEAYTADIALGNN